MTNPKATPREEAIQQARKDNGDIVLMAIDSVHRGCYSCFNNAELDPSIRLPKGPGEEEKIYVGCSAQKCGYAELRIKCPNWKG